MSNAVARPDPAAPTHCTASDYAEMYRRSVEAPDAFWLEQAGRLDWVLAPTMGGDWSYDPVAIKWFEDGALNLCHNAVDRHLPHHTGRTALILPCLGRTERDVQTGGEQFVTTEDSMGIINRSRGRLTPGSPHLRSEPWIVAALGRALGAGGGRIPWDELAADYDRIRDRIGSVVPGCEDYTRRVRSAPFALPNPVRERREWRTPNGKANFLPAPIPPDWEQLQARAAAGGTAEHVMMTIRTHDQFNTTVYGLDDRLRGVFGGRRVVFMHEEDIRAEIGRAHV